MQVVGDYVRRVNEADLCPDHYVLHEKNGNRVKVEQESDGVVFEAVNFGGNDVFGFSQNPAVKQAAIDAIEKFGTSNSSCAALCGRTSLHRDLENEISAFKGMPNTYLFLNAWMAMQAVFDGFCHLAVPVPEFRNERQTLILTDVFNHGCITSAVTNSGNRSGKMFTQSPDVRVKSYRHVDMENLKYKLAPARSTGRSRYRRYRRGFLHERRYRATAGDDRRSVGLSRDCSDSR